MHEAEDKREALKKEASSPFHHLSQRPKNSYCETCTRAKMQRRPGRRIKPGASRGPLPVVFGDSCTIDH
eukprot:9393138-Prorocentrum_lima.AAC.1